MVDAEKIDYTSTSVIFGGSMGLFVPDKFIKTPGRAIFVESEEMLVQTNNQRDVVCGALHLMYTVKKGDIARVSYDLLKDELSKDGKEVEPKKIEVPTEFIDWANALHDAQRPKDDIAKILSLI